MKTIQMYWDKADRASWSLALILLVVLLHVIGCAKPAKAMPADEITSELTQASRIPDWAPADADPRVRYYFLPEIDVYYDAFAGQYIYMDQGVWLAGPALPQVHLSFDLSLAHIVFLEVGGTRPWVMNHYYVTTYPVTYFYGHPGLHRGYGWRCYNENRRHFHKGYVHHAHGGHGHPDNPHWVGGPKPGKVGGPTAMKGKPAPGYKSGPKQGGAPYHGGGKSPAYRKPAFGNTGKGSPSGGKSSGLGTISKQPHSGGSQATRNGGWNTPSASGGKAPHHPSPSKTSGGGKGNNGRRGG